MNQEQMTKNEFVGLMQNQRQFLQNSMNILAGELYRNTTEHAGWANSFQQQLDAAFKKRKKCSGICELAVADNRLVLLENYDDGTADKIEFAPNLPSVFHILKMRSKMLPNVPCFFLIRFLNMDGEEIYFVVGEEKKISPKYLYECFLCAEIAFSPLVSQKKVSEALYRFFLPKIKNAREEVEMIELTGWCGENYFYAENLPYADFRIELDLPVMRKHLKVEEDSGRVADYVTALQTISQWKDRLLLLVYPFAGIISSILEKYGCLIPVVTNFVIIDEAMEKIIMAFLKIFNRKCLSPLSVMELKGGLKQLLMDTRDEVLCIEVKTGNLISAYQKEKQEKNKEKCKNYAFARGAVGTEREFNSFALAMFSDVLYPKADVINILVSDDFCNDSENCLKLLRNGCFQRVISYFMEYVSSNYANVISIIEDCINEGENNKFWNAILPIIENFWNSYEIFIFEELKIPDIINPTAIFEMNFEEDWSEIFVHRFRQYLPKLRVLPKEAQSKGGFAEIYYNWEFLWLIPEALECFLHDSGLFEAKNCILCALNESGILVTDADGYKRKFTIDGKRREVYQLKREKFNRTGLPDIISLAEEGE